MAKEEVVAIGYPVCHHYYDELPSSSVPPRKDRRVLKALALLAVFACFLMVLGVILFLRPIRLEVHVRKTELVSMSWARSEEQNGRLSLGLDLKFRVQLEVRNANIYGLSYDRAVVTLGYRGDELGDVVLEGGDIPPLSSVDVEGVVELKGFKVLKHAAGMLIEILDGRLRLETRTDFTGNLKVFFLRSPNIHTKVNCETLVNPQTNEILSQSCLFGG